MNKLISNRWFQYAMPFMIWFLLLILPYLPGTSNNIPEEIRTRILDTIILSNILLLCLFYIHTYLLYPLLNKKIIGYVLGLIVVLVVYWVCGYLLWFKPSHANHFSHLTDSNAFHRHQPPFDQASGRGGHGPRGWRGFGGPPNFIPI